MAIGTPTQLIDAGISGASVTSASFTPSADTTIFAYVTVYQNTTVPNDPTISDSLGGTWNSITIVPYDPGVNRRQKSRLFWQHIGGSPASMTVTAGVTGALETNVVVSEVSGVNESDFSNVASATNSAGDPSVTISAVGGTSAVMGWAAAQGSNAFTPPTGYTEIFDAEVPLTRRVTTVYDLTSPGTTLTWASTNTRTTAVALELKEASAGGPQNIDGTLYADPDTFHGGTVSFPPQAVSGTLYVDGDTFGAGTVAPGPVNVQGSLYADPDTFYNAVIAGGAITIGSGGGLLIRRRRR